MQAQMVKMLVIAHTIKKGDLLASIIDKEMQDEALHASWVHLKCAIKGVDKANIERNLPNKIIN